MFSTGSHDVGKALRTTGLFQPALVEWRWKQQVLGDVQGQLADSNHNLKCPVLSRSLALQEEELHRGLGYSFFSEAVLHLPCSPWLPLPEVHGGGTPVGPPEEEGKLVSFFCLSFLGKIAPVSICPCEKNMKLTTHGSCHYLLRAPQMALHPDKTKTLLGTKYCTNWPDAPVCRIEYVPFPRAASSLKRKPVRITAKIIVNNSHEMDGVEEYIDLVRFMILRYQRKSPS